MATYHQSMAVPMPQSTPVNGSRWQVVTLLLPYLSEYKWRVAIALTLLIDAKLANVGVPLVLKAVVDSLDPTRAVLVLPLALLVGYGLLRLSTTLFAELGTSCLCALRRERSAVLH